MHTHVEPNPSTDCPTCGAQLRADDTFCLECGHDVTYRNPEYSPDESGELNVNAGDICPNCGATHMVLQQQGFPQCESCGYTERH